MSKLTEISKLAIVAAALLLFAWSAMPRSADAGGSITCEGQGHTCHLLNDSGVVVGHYKLQKAV